MKKNPFHSRNLPARILLLILGLFFLAFGIALSTKSGLGVSPSASLAYVLSLAFPLSMGTFTTLLNLVYLLIQLLLLRREFHLSRLLQLAVVFLFGYFTDFTLRLVAPVNVESYPLRLLLCVFACAVMGFGVFLEVRANVIVMASEGALSVIASKSRKEFGTIKIINDCALIVITVLVSLAFLKRITGVREGTILAAVLVGLCTQFYNRHIHVFDRFFDSGEKVENNLAYSAEDLPLVITIEREWGSGGHEIGERLARELGIGFYDYELIEQVAAETGLPAETVRRKEERVKGIFYTLYNQANAYSRSQSAEDAIFAAQSKIIRELAGKESCVIVGRLGAYILRERKNAFHVFLSAGDAFRVERLSKQSRLPEAELLDLMHREDELRHSYCQHFTGKDWGYARHYHLCLDTSTYGIENSYQMIRKAIQMISVDKAGNRERLGGRLTQRAP